MKKLVYSILSVSLLSMLVLSGCKKEKEPEPTNKAAQNDQTGATEADDVLANVNDYISNSSGLGNGAQRVAAYDLPCGVVSVTTTGSGASTVYTMNYGNATPCGYKYKSGQVIFQLTNGNSFDEAGAKFTVTFSNYKVEVRATGSEVTLNGIITVTNVSGNYIWEVINDETIVHTLRGALNITYDNGVTRIRQYFQRRTWTSTNSEWTGFSLSIDGDSIVSTEHISETGRTLEGDYVFKTVIATPFKWENCGSTWAGPYVLKEGDATLDVTIPLISPTTINVKAGYYWDYATVGSSPGLTPVNNCTSNTYKIITTIGNGPNNVTTEYQLY